MLFRSRTPETNLEHRFRSTATLFAFRKEADVCVAEIRVGAERAVELFHSLTGQMPPIVNLSIECLRTGREFTGEGLQLSEVKEAIARLKTPLVASGGVEISVHSADDQIALSAMLDLWIFAKSDRWFYLLLSQGLEERAKLPERSWTLSRSDFTGAPQMVEAVTAAAERLTLTLA